MLRPNRWQQITPYLDQALALDDEEREAWVASVREQDPEIGDLLQSLLEEHRILLEENFLEENFLEEGRTSMAGLAGQTIGPYTLLSKIGQGGMGSVWVAKRSDGRFERQVAIKFLSVALVGRAGEERFKREGNILGSLAHPHIAELIDAGVSRGGQPYLILEYVKGEHIDCYCDQAALDIEARIRLFLDVLAAVGHAHSHLIVHRDIKPPNVLVRNDGHVKLLDFGIAKLLEDEVTGTRFEGSAGSLTVEGARPMTPLYAAPEQLMGAPITTGADVYGLGVLLYVLLTGQHPAGTGPRSHAELVKAIVDTEPALPSEIVAPKRDNSELTDANAAKRGMTAERLRRSLRGDLDTIVAKALKKNPAERYPSVTALADDLRRYLQNEAIGARPDTALYRAAKFMRRNRTVAALAALASMATAAGLVGTLMQARTARSQRDFAFRQVARSAALNEFHQFLLSDAAPSGKPLKVCELLDRAEKIVARQHAANDPNRVELMISIGRQYLEQDEAASARRVLTEAYKLSRTIPDASIRAEASCSLASSLARDEGLARAETLFQQGMRELPEGPQFALERIGCLQNGSEVAREQNDVRKAIARAEAAQRVLRESPFDSEALEMHRWLDLGTAYGAAGKDSEALYAFERTRRLLSSLGRDETATAAALFDNLGLKLEQMGRPLEAERMYRRAIDISSEGQTDESLSSAILLNNYARSLRELGRLTEAASYAERAYGQAQRASLQLALNQSLIERARIYTAQHRPSRAAEMLAEAEPALRKDLPAGHYAFAALASVQSLNALEEGDVAAALKLANQAVSLDEKAIQAGRDGIFYLPILLVHRSEIELAAQRPELASADADRALNQLRRTALPGTFSSFRGYAYLALGRALRCKGKNDHAQAAFRSAAQELQNSLGTEHRDTRIALQLAGGSGAT